MIPRARLLLTLAVQGLRASPVRSVLLGSLLFGASLLVVLGSAMTRSLTEAMERSITEGFAGHLQVYSADAAEPLQLLRGDFASENIGEIHDYPALEEELLAVDNVAAVLPMGVMTAAVTVPNAFDEALAELRELVASEASEAELAAGAAHVRRLVAEIGRDVESREGIIAPERARQDRQLVERALSDAFWSRFRDDPLAVLDDLDVNVAPLSGHASSALEYLRIIAVDPAQFPEIFERVYVVRGEWLEPGTRGIVFHDRAYEDKVKSRAARDLDLLAEAVMGGSDLQAASHRQRIVRLVNRHRSLALKLRPEQAAQLDRELSALLPEVDGDLSDRLQAFLDVDATNAVERRDWFYEHIGPLVGVYDVAIGAPVNLRAFSNAGYSRSLAVPLTGTVQLRGLERSDLLSLFNVVFTDLETFRLLYGSMTDAQRAELADIRAEVGVEDISADDPVAALFGGGSLVQEAEVAELDRIESIEAVHHAPTYDPGLLRTGMIHSASIVLEDPSRMEATRAEIDAVLARAGRPLQVTDWKNAAGLTGQMVVVFQALLYLSLGLVFIVTGIILNNALVTATLARTREIGTLRAIGASRTLVLLLLLGETLLLAALAGLGGAALGGSILAALGQSGIPASSDLLVFLFGGERLHPSVSGHDLLLGVLSVTALASVSMLWPAAVAVRVQPVVALQDAG